MSDHKTPVSKSDQHSLPPHWDTEWADNGVSDNLLPGWLAGIWIIFLVWAVLYLIDHSSAW